MTVPKKEPWRCPSCGKRAHVEVFSETSRKWFRKRPPAYCPSCGARQEER